MEWRWLFERQNGNVGTGAGETDSTAPSIATTAQDSLPTIPGTGEQDNTDGTGQTGDSGGRGSDDNKDRVITFELSSTPSERIFDPDRLRGMAPIPWKRNSSVIIEAVSWKGLNGRQGDSYQDIAQIQFKNGETEGSVGDFLMSVDEQGANLDLANFADGSRLADFRANNMIMRIRWLVEDTNIRGNTESGKFTVGSLDDPRDNLKLRRFQDQFGRFPDEDYEGTETPDSESGTVRGGTSSVSGLPTSSTSGAVEPTIVESDDTASSGGGSGGLSTGAIAGIAVAGGVVFLALIAGLIFWMLRRRRSNKDRGQYNKPTTSTTSMGADKENHQVTESPHSTYSHDQEVPLSSLGGAGTSRDIGAASGHHHRHHDDDDGDYTPYRDDDAVVDGPATERRADGAGTPHGVSRSVAHLVEEGMTADEIRRLEDEERQLDDAIQRHGQGR